MNSFAKLYICELNNLFPTRLYHYQQLFLGNNKENEIEPMTCQYCYNKLHFPEDSLKIIRRKKALEKRLIQFNTPKNKVIIRSRCHFCNQTSIFLEDKVSPKVDCLTKKQDLERKKKKDLRKTVEVKDKECKPNKSSSKTKSLNEDEFRKSLVKEMRKKSSKLESQKAQDARSSLLSFLKQID